MAATQARLAGQGLATATEDNVTCCYAVQDKVWVEDPDGNAWEVFVVKGEAAVMEKQATSTGCCVPKIDATEKAKASGGCGG